MPPLPFNETTAPLQPSALVPQRWSGVTPRAWIISLALIPLVVFWVEYNEIVAQGSELAGMSLTMAAVFPLLLLIAMNLLLKKWRPRWALRQSELMFWTEPHFPYQCRESTLAGTGQFVKFASNSVGGK